VAVVGGSATGCEAAELLAARGAAVTILEMRGSVGHGIEAITRRQLLRALKSDGVRILTRAKVVAIDPDQVLYELVAAEPAEVGASRDGDATHAVPADLVALALGWRPSGDRLAEELDGVETLVLGDAAHAADFVQAINTGADAGLAI
jgi:2,4-dienoyl-CoA reductase (NADPH2)